MCNLFHSAKIIYNLNINFLQVVRMNIAIYKNLFTYFSEKSSKQQSKLVTKHAEFETL